MGEYQKAIDNSQKLASLFSESLNLRPISLMNIFPSSLGALLSRDSPRWRFENFYNSNRIAISLTQGYCIMDEV
jgi:hypothetical protein